MFSSNRSYAYSLSFFRFVALWPRSESSTSYSTGSPSLRLVPSGTAVLWTKTSFSSSPAMKPYPFMPLYHLIVPFICFSPPQTAMSGIVKRTENKKFQKSEKTKLRNRYLLFFLTAVVASHLNNYLF